MVTTWVLVGDASRARVFAVRGEKLWTVVREFTHPASRAAGRNLISDRPGRSQQRATPTRSAMEPTTPPKEVEAEHFAHSLAEFVRLGLAENEYAKLVLVAPPHFLGLLRERIGPQVTKHVALSVDKDLTALHVRDLTVALKDEMSPLYAEARVR